MRLSEDQRKTVEALRPLALHIARKDGTVEDACSIAMISLCKAVAKYPGGIDLKAYVMSRVRRDVRSPRRKRIPIPTDELNHVEARPAGDGIDVPDELRDVLEVRFRQGHTSEETAEKLGIGLRTVERRSSEIREYLRNQGYGE